MKSNTPKPLGKLAGAAFILLGLAGCADFKNAVIYTDETKTASTHKGRYYDKELGSYIEISADGGQIIESFSMNFHYVHIGKRWKMLEGRGGAPDVVRPTGSWMPDSYGPFGWEGNNIVTNYNDIYAEWPRNETDLNYCVTQCSINIKLYDRGAKETGVRVTYTNPGGKAEPFAKDMRVALRYYFYTRPDGVLYEDLEDEDK